MSTGKAEGRRRNECCETLEVLTLGTIFAISCIILGFGALLHTTVHYSNSCSMTYMYRKLQFLEIPMAYGSTNKYNLVVYNEGNRWWNRSFIEAGQIPVLFIPGSQGSAKQVRSLASVMQNKTESRGSPFSFRFFAVDFDEEVTFMNGNIGNRQLDYVMHAIRKIQSMMRVKRKVVLVGHSYGGMIAVLTTIHQDYRDDIELVILKGAPINKQPILVDWMSMRLSMFLVNQWEELQAKELQHVGVVAYSGGIRDYLIPDDWSILPNITHRPLWAIDGVSDLGADHLAILWCNEFVRHVSRVLWAYGENLNNMTGRAIVQKFYNNVTDANVKRANLSRHVADVPWKEIKVGERYKGLVVESKQLALLVKPAKYEVLVVRVNGSCVNTLTTVRHNEDMMHFQNATDGVVETWVYRILEREKIRLLLDVSLPCSIDVQLTEPTRVNFYRVHELIFSNLLEVGGTFITFCTLFAALVREPSHKRNKVIVLSNIMAILCFGYGMSNTQDNITLPMAIGYFMALAWRFVCFLIGDLLFSRISWVISAHKALRDEKLTNGLFLVCGALTITGTNEGSIVMLILFAFRHHPTSVVLIIPAIIPHFLKIASFPLFTIDSLVLYEIQYQPTFYAACIYLWGMYSQRNVTQTTMRLLIFGLTPTILYLLSSPLELFSGHALLVFAAARHVDYSKKKSEEQGSATPKPSPNPQRQQQRGQRQQQQQNQYGVRQRRN